MKFTRYFLEMRQRPDRGGIRQEWLDRALHNPLREEKQADGRIRRWIRIDEAGPRYLRVIVLPDGETVHNAFFDRRFKP
jgi:hypothetical protein